MNQLAASRGWGSDGPQEIPSTKDARRAEAQRTHGQRWRAIMALHDDEKWSAGGGKQGNMLGFRVKDQ